MADEKRNEGAPGEARDFGVPGYRVTADGAVWSVASNWRGRGARPLAAHPTDGYLCVRVRTNDGRRKLRVHKIVAAAFLPPRPSPRHEVRHLDGDRTHNAAANLAWGTRKENADDRARHGRTQNQFTKGTANRAEHGLAIRAGMARAALRAARGEE